MHDPAGDHPDALHLRPLMVTVALLVVTAASFELVSWTVLPTAALELDGDELYGLVNAIGPLGGLGALVYAGVVIDHRGCRTVARWGLAASAVGAVLVMLAPSMYAIAFGRLIAGVGNGFVSGAGIAAVSIAMPSRLRPKAFALMSAVWFPSAVIFPQLASLLRDAVDWRVAYVPALATAVLTLLLSAVLPRRQPHVEGDIPAGAREAAVIVGGVGLFVLGSTVKMPLPLTIGAIVLSFVFTLPRLRRLLPAGTLTAQPGLPAAILNKGIWGFAVGSLQLFETIAMIRVLHAPGWLVGVSLAVVELGVAVGGWLFSRVHMRHSLRDLLRVSAVLGICGAVAFALVVGFEASMYLVLIPMFIRHVGWGVGYNACSEAITVLSDVHKRGRMAASGNLMVNLGFTVGPALVGLAFAHLDAVPGELRGAIVFAAAASVVGFIAVALTAGRIHAEQR
jgi:MFS family permease